MIISLAPLPFPNQPTLWPTVYVIVCCWKRHGHVRISFSNVAVTFYLRLIGNWNGPHERAAEPLGPISPFLLAALRSLALGSLERHVTDMPAPENP